MEFQIRDDFELLQLMMEHLERCDDLYQPTNYWAHYEGWFLPELKERGLEDFRRRKGSILSSFGATDLLLLAEVRIGLRFRIFGRRLSSLLTRLLERFLFASVGTSVTRPAWVTEYFYWYTREKFERIGLDLRKCPTSRFGNPEDIVEIENRVWSATHLQYCSMFADAARLIGIQENSIICELGPGMGRNVEVMAHLLDRATFLLFDIPPQLYVANQYLTAVFGSRVVPYRDAMSIVPDGRDLPEEVAGKIVILPTWRMPTWSSTKIDLFWNSASFHEMEPDVVRNYLKLVRGMEAKWIYINAMPGGNYWGEWKPGRGGTKEPVLEKCYREALADSYILVQTYDTDYFLMPRDHKSYIYRSVGSSPGLARDRFDRAP